MPTILEVPDVHYNDDGTKLIRIECGSDYLELTADQALIFKADFERAFRQQQSETR